jgi:hypothetical protein
MARPGASPAAASLATGRISGGDVLALILLGVVFAVFVARSWLAWGDLDADYGREMFVPLRISQGDVIYRDVRYPYGPLIPYAHAFGYRMFGPQLGVLYASGLFATTLCILLLYAFARQLSSISVATAGTGLAVVDLMFIPGSIGSFSYIFPYSFPTLYGLVFALAAFTAGMRLLVTGSHRLAIAAGCAIGLALLTKQEFGVLALGAGACAFVGLALLGRSNLVRFALELAGPAVAIALVGYGALALAMPAGDIWRRGLSSQYLGWPLTWMIAGFQPGSSAGEMAATLAERFWKAGLWYPLPVALVVAAGLGFGLSRGSPGEQGHGLPAWLRIASLVVLSLALFLLIHALAPLVAGAVKLGPTLERRYAAFPVLLAGWLVLETVRIGRGWLRGESIRPRALQRWIAVAFALALLLRVVGSLVPLNFANFYLGPSIILACVLLAELLPSGVARIGGSPRASRLAALCLTVALATTIGSIRHRRFASRTTELATPHGTLYLESRDNRTPAYRAALDLIRASTPPAATILAVPTEPSFYFLTGRGNRLYETALVASLTTEEEEREYIRALEADPPELILTSNRIQPEYGRILFGHDYNQLIYAWITKHYVAGETLGRGFRIQVWRPRDEASLGRHPG